MDHISSIRILLQSLIMSNLFEVSQCTLNNTIIVIEQGDILRYIDSVHIYKTGYEVISKDLLNNNRKIVLGFRTQNTRRFRTTIIANLLCKYNMRNMIRAHDPSR